MYHVQHIYLFKFPLIHNITMYFTSCFSGEYGLANIISLYLFQIISSDLQHLNTSNLLTRFQLPAIHQSSISLTQGWVSAMAKTIFAGTVEKTVKTVAKIKDTIN